MQITARPPKEIIDMQLRGWRNLVWGYYGKLLELYDGPQAFLVDLPEPGATVEPHFHDVDQFQVIVRGEGRFGKDRVSEFCFHYADAYTPYGPIVGPADGISFFTLRGACAGGHFSMPGSRHLMKTRAGRNTGGRFAVNQPLPAASEVRREILLSDARDGMQAVGLALGPGAQAEGLATDAGTQYYVVCTGTLTHDGRDYGRLSLVYVEPGDATPIFRAGPQGAEVLALQLPRASERIGSRPEPIAARTGTNYTLPEGTVVQRTQ